MKRCNTTKYRKRRARECTNKLDREKKRRAQRQALDQLLRQRQREGVLSLEEVAQRAQAQRLAQIALLQKLLLCRMVQLDPEEGMKLIKTREFIKAFRGIVRETLTTTIFA